MTSSATTWRSPLSILMGARRNDDADLELREDYFHPRSSRPAAAAAPPKSPAAAAENSAEPTPSRSGFKSYVPFSYFGLTSPAPSKAENGQNNKNGAESNHLQTAPPRGAFPPPISESPEGRHHDGSPVEEGEYVDERGREGGDHPQISHPWFNRLALTDPENESDDANEDDRPTDRRRLFAAPKARARTGYVTWKDQKAIMSTTFNFTNSIIGAGAMGLGGAFAASGGGISVLMIIGFAILTKVSLDLVVDLSSDPAIIRMARTKDDRRGIEIIDFYESSSSESDTLSGESQNNEPSTQGNPFGDILDAIEEAKSGDNEQSIEDDGPEVDESPKDVELAADESSQQDANNNSSPLMAAEDGGDENDGAADALQTPRKTAGLGVDHPLMPTQEPLLTMDVTAPRHFSPLNLNPDNLPAEKPTHSIENDNPMQQIPDLLTPCTYEELGQAAFGTVGRMSVLISKALYSFGCLVAYVVVVRDNFGLALRRIAIGPSSPNSIEGNGHGWLYDDDFLAFWVSALFMLPLSCPRTMKPLAKFSFVSILSIVFLVLVVIYLYFTCTNPESGPNKASFYENWIEIRSFSGFVESLGTFVFTFVCHHTVNLAYESLPQPIRNPRVWRRVSTNSITVAAEASLAIGIFAYLTFGSQTPADVLMGYPDLVLADVARLLLCVTMVLTFPLPFLTCREMSILICLDMHSFYYLYGLDEYNFCGPISSCISGVSAGVSAILARIRGEQQDRQTVPESAAEDEAEFVHVQRPSFFKSTRQYAMAVMQRVDARPCTQRRNVASDPDEEWWDEVNGNEPLTQALLSEEERETAAITTIGGEKGKEINPSPLSSRSGDPSSSEATIASIVVPTPSWILADGRQLSLPWHAALTFSLWFVITICAIKSPSLGDVLDLVGAFSGTLMAFVLPALFSFELKGYTHLSLAILGIGGTVGLLGSVFSSIKFMDDTT